MCEMRVSVLREMLGNREICYTLWDGVKVMEMTSNQIKNTIKAGNKVCGLTIGASGELELDKEGFYCTNIMEHRHSGNYTPMFSEGCMSNLFYIVIGSHEDKETGKVLYDCISTRFERLSIDEASLKAYLKIGIVSAGATVVDDQIVLADLEFPKAENVPVEKVEAAKVEKADQPVVTEPAKTEEKKSVEAKVTTPEKGKSSSGKK